MSNSNLSDIKLHASHVTKDFWTPIANIGTTVVNTSSYPAVRNNFAFEVTGLGPGIALSIGGAGGSIIENGDIVMFNRVGDFSGAITKTTASNKDWTTISDLLPTRVGTTYQSAAGDSLLIGATLPAILSSFIIDLPPTPSPGQLVSISPLPTTLYSATPITVGRNGRPINGGVVDYILNVDGISLDFYYVDNLTGWATIAQGSASVISVPTEKVWAEKFGPSNYNAITGDNIFANTFAGVLNIYLPVNPVFGATIAIAPSLFTYETFEVNIYPGLEKIAGAAFGEELVLNTNGVSIELIFVDGITGWAVVNRGSTTIIGAGTDAKDISFATWIPTPEVSTIAAPLYNKFGGAISDNNYIYTGENGDFVATDYIFPSPPIPPIVRLVYFSIDEMPDQHNLVAAFLDGIPPSVTSVLGANINLNGGTWNVVLGSVLSLDNDNPGTTFAYTLGETLCLEFDSTGLGALTLHYGALLASSISYSLLDPYSVTDRFGFYIPSLRPIKVSIVENPSTTVPGVQLTQPSKNVDPAFYPVGNSNRAYEVSGLTEPYLITTAGKISNGDSVFFNMGGVLKQVFSNTTRYLDGVTSNVQNQIDSKFNTSKVGVANGVATLDGGGKVPASQLPSTVMEYKGIWDASGAPGGSPTLADGVGDTGDVYRVSVAGTQTFNSIIINFNIGDFIIFNGSVWEHSDTTDAVVSVNTLTGIVTLDTDDISEGTTNKYFASGLALSNAWTNTNSFTTAPTVSGNSVLTTVTGGVLSGINAWSNTNSFTTAPTVLGNSVLTTITGGVLSGTNVWSGSNTFNNTFLQTKIVSGITTGLSLLNSSDVTKAELKYNSAVDYTTLSTSSGSLSVQNAAGATVALASDGAVDITAAVTKKITLHTSGLGSGIVLDGFLRQSNAYTSNFEGTVNFTGPFSITNNSNTNLSFGTGNLNVTTTTGNIDIVSSGASAPINISATGASSPIDISSSQAVVKLYSGSVAAIVETDTGNIQFVVASNTIMGINQTAGRITISDGWPLEFLGSPGTETVITVNSTNISSAELSYLDTVSSNIQTQLDDKESIAKSYNSLSSAAGVVTINLASSTTHYILTLTENITSWVFNNLPAAGKYIDISIDVVQDSITPRTVVTPASAGRTAGGPWVVSGAVSTVETLSLRIDDTGQKSLYFSDILL